MAKRMVWVPLVVLAIVAQGCTPPGLASTLIPVQSYPPRVDEGPSWSPDGTKIVFVDFESASLTVSPYGGYYQIYVMNVDGSNVVQLTQTMANDASVAWSPDGQKIAFKSDRGGHSEIYVMDADGSHTTRLMHTEVGWDCDHPTWSPDSQRIAFMCHVQRGLETLRSEWGIYVVAADGSNPTHLTPVTGVDLDWSSGGGKLAFTAGGICVLEIGSPPLVCLTDPSVPEDHPSWSTYLHLSWSPDGQRIAFESRRDGSGHQIHVMNTDGSGFTQLTNIRGGAHYPAWSSDGRKLAFVVYSQDCNGIATIDADGSGFTCLWNRR